MVPRAVPVLLLVLLAAPVPRDGAAGPARKYDCARLLTSAEMKTATGLADVAFTLQGFGTDSGSPAESTSCRFSAKQGAVSIGLTVATGAAVPLSEAAVFSGAGAAREPLPAIGDGAVYIPQGHSAGARARGVVIVVRFQGHRPNALDGLDVKGAAARILKVVVGRV
jgi:hypothetical protein